MFEVKKKWFLRSGGAPSAVQVSGPATDQAAGEPEVPLRPRHEDPAVPGRGEVPRRGDPDTVPPNPGRSKGVHRSDPDKGS